MRHLNMFKTAAEINRLRELVNNQRETIKKSMQVIEHQIDENIKLQAENKKLKEENQKLKGLVEFHKYMRKSPDDIIFPNTDPRGLNDSSNSEPDGLDNIY